MTNPTLLQTVSLPEFFREQIHDSILDTKAIISADAEFYLVNLLTEFSVSDTLFDQTHDGHLEDKALALLWLESLQKKKKERIFVLKKLGDKALYTSGFFSDSLTQKLVDSKYVMKMGMSAYGSLADLYNDNPEKKMSALYDELSKKFGDVVRVISNVAVGLYNRSEKDLLKLYEKWQLTGSQKIKEKLFEEGLLPYDYGNPELPQ